MVLCTFPSDIGDIIMDEGWMMPSEVFQWCHSNISKGSMILEFGSGHGTILLGKNYEVISIEHDEKWLGVANSRYIHAPIVSNSFSNAFNEEGWYDYKVITDLPDKFDLVIIDGPPGNIGRSGILGFIDSIPPFEWLIVDDTDRKQERVLVEELVKILSPTNLIELISEQLRENGVSRQSTILQMRL